MLFRIWWWQWLEVGARYGANVFIFAISFLALLCSTSTLYTMGTKHLRAKSRIIKNNASLFKCSCSGRAVADLNVSESMIDSLSENQSCKVPVWEVRQHTSTQNPVLFYSQQMCRNDSNIKYIQQSCLQGWLLDIAVLYFYAIWVVKYRW